MAINPKYKFTNKQIPPQSVRSAALGVISVAGIIAVTILSFKNEGVAEVRYGVTVILAAVFSIIGLVLGVWSRMIKDVYYFWAYFGIAVNSLVLFFVIYLLGLGIMAM